MPKNFQQIYEAMQRARDAGGLPDLNMQQFSQLANTLSGTQDYNAGNTGMLGRAGQYVDMFTNKALEATGLPQASADITGKLYEALGANRQAGEEMGRGIPGMVARFVPTIATAGASWPVAAAGLAATSGLEAAHALGETGDTKQAALAAATIPVGVGAGHAFGELFRHVAPAAVAGPASWLGSNLGFLGATGEMHNVVSGEGLFANPLPKTKEEWLGAAVSQVPFIGYDAIKRLFGAKAQQDTAIDNNLNNATPPDATPLAPLPTSPTTPPPTPSPTTPSLRRGGPPPAAGGVAPRGPTSPPPVPPGRGFSIWTEPTVFGVPAAEKARTDASVAMVTGDESVARAKAAADESAINRRGEPDTQVDKAVADFEAMLRNHPNPDEVGKTAPRPTPTGEEISQPASLEAQPPTPPAGYEYYTDDQGVMRLRKLTASERLTQQSNAIQEPSTGTLLQREPSQNGSTGSQRGRVEPSKQGQEAPQTSQTQGPRPSQGRQTVGSQGEQNRQVSRPIQQGPLGPPNLSGIARPVEPVLDENPLGMGNLPGEDQHTLSQGRRFTIGKAALLRLPKGVAKVVAKFKQDGGTEFRLRPARASLVKDPNSVFFYVDPVTGLETATAGQHPGGLQKGQFMVEYGLRDGKNTLTIHYGVDPTTGPVAVAPRLPGPPDIKPDDVKTPQDVVQAVSQANAIRSASGHKLTTDEEMRQSVETNAAINGTAEPNRTAAASVNEANAAVTNQEKMNEVKRARRKRNDPENIARLRALNPGGRPKGVAPVAEAANKRLEEIFKRGTVTDNAVNEGVRVYKEYARDPGRFLNKRLKEQGAEAWFDPAQALRNYFVQWHDEVLPRLRAEGKTDEEIVQRLRDGLGKAINNEGRAKGLYGAPLEENGQIVKFNDDADAGEKRARAEAARNRNPDIKDFVYLKGRDVVVPVFRDRAKAAEHRADRINKQVQDAGKVISSTRTRLSKEGSPEAKLAQASVNDATAEAATRVAGKDPAQMGDRELAQVLRTLLGEDQVDVQAVVDKIAQNPEMRKIAEQKARDLLASRAKRNESDPTGEHLLPENQIDNPQDYTSQQTPESGQFSSGDRHSLADPAQPSRRALTTAEVQLWLDEHNIHLGRVGVMEAQHYPWEARAVIYNGRVERIDLNAAKLFKYADIERALNHEIAEAANAEGVLNDLMFTLRPEESKAISRDIDRLGYEKFGYSKKQLSQEAAARGVEKLAEAWRNRSWFSKIAGRVMAWAHEKGWRMTRAAAEYIAAKHVADIHNLLKSAPKEAPLSVREATQLSNVAARNELVPELAQRVMNRVGLPPEQFNEWMDLLRQEHVAVVAGVQMDVAKLRRLVDLTRMIADRVGPSLATPVETLREGIKNEPAIKQEALKLRSTIFRGKLRNTITELIDSRKRNPRIANDLALERKRLVDIAKGSGIPVLSYEEILNRYGRAFNGGAEHIVHFMKGEEALNAQRIVKFLHHADEGGFWGDGSWLTYLSRLEGSNRVFNDDLFVDSFIQDGRPVVSQRFAPPSDAWRQMSWGEVTRFIFNDFTARGWLPHGGGDFNAWDQRTFFSPDGRLRLDDAHGQNLWQVPSGATRVIDVGVTSSNKNLNIVELLNTVGNDLRAFGFRDPDLAGFVKHPNGVIETRHSLAEGEMATRELQDRFEPEEVTGSEREPHGPWMLPTMDEVVTRNLRKQGWTQEQIDAAMPSFSRMQDFMGLNDVQFGELVNDALVNGREVLGLAVTNDSTRRIFLAASKEMAKRGKTEQGLMSLFYMAHEGAHAIRTLGDRGVLDEAGQRAFDVFYKSVETMTPEQMSDVLELARSGLLPRAIRDLPEFHDIVKNPGTADEFQANLMAMWAMAKSGEDVALTAALMPAESRGFLHTISKWVKQMVSALRGGALVQNKGNMRMLKDLTRKMTEMRRSFDDAEQKIGQLRTFFDGGADAIPRLQASALRVVDDHTVGIQQRLLASLASRALGPVSLKDKVLREASMWLEQIEQLAARVPQIKPMAAQVFRFPEFIRSFIHQTRGNLLGGVDEAGVPTHRGREYDQYQRVQQENSPTNSRLFSDLARVQQTDKKFIDWSTLDRDHPELAQRLNALPAKDREAIVGVLTRTRNAMRLMQDRVVDTLREEGVNRTALLMANQRPDLFDQIYEMASDMHRNIDFSTRVMDEQTRAMVAQSEAQLRAAFDPEAYAKLYEHATKSYQSVLEQGAKFDERRWYLPEIRIGNFEVVATKPGEEPLRLNALDAKEAQRIAAQAVKDGWSNPVITKMDRTASKVALTDDLKTMLGEYQTKMNALVDAMPFTPDQKAQLKEQDVVQYLRDEINAAKVFDGVLREHTPGREYLDMLKTFDGYTSVLARALSNKLLKSRLAFERLRPELRSVPDQVNQLEMVANNMLRPDTELGKMITMGQSVYFLGGNIPNMMAEYFQPWMSVLPEVIAKGHSVLDASKMVLKANGDVARIVAKMFKRKLGDRAIDVFEGLPADEAAMLRWRAETGGLGHGYLTEVIDSGADSAIDARRIGSGETKLGKLADTLMKPARAFADFTMRSYAAFQHNNEMLALLTGYRIAKKEMGANFDRQKAYDRAVDFARTVTYSGGRAGRAAKPWNGEGRLLAHAAFGLQKYFLSWVSQFARYVQHGFGKDLPYDITPAQKAQAQKAAYTMLAVQLGMAGALGVPFAGAALELLEKLTGIPFRAKIYEHANDLFDQDSKAGGVLADVVMRGAADTLTGQLGVPVNMSRRFGLDGILGFSEYDGYSASNFFGPSGSMVKSLFTGVGDVAKDHDLLKAARDVAPMPLRKAIDLALNGGEVTTGQGNIVPDVTTKEKVLTAMGFQSDKARRLADAERYIQDVKAAQTADEAKVVNDIVGQMDNPAAMRETFNNAVQGSKLYAPALAEKVANAAVRKAFPLDPRAEGSRTTAGAVSNIVANTGAPVPPPQNRDALALREQVMRALGAAHYRPDMRRATALDAMQAAAPTSSAAELFSQPRYAGRHQAGQPF